MATDFAPTGPGGAFDVDPLDGLCTWDVTYPNGTPPPPLDTLDDVQRTMYEKMAGQYLWNWTSRMFGSCWVSVRPCRTTVELPTTFYGAGPYPSRLSHTGTGYWPAIISGSLHALGCGTCQDACLCNSTKVLTLPGPIASIEEVLVDGAILDPSAYRVDNKFQLVRLDGEGWPTTQDLLLPTTEVGTFAVTYMRGLGVPYGGQMAAGVLAQELAKAYTRDATCALPQRVQSITRQGVTIAVLDAFDDIDTGHTGIWSIDSWVASVTRPARPSMVRSPDVPRGRNRVTTWP